MNLRRRIVCSRGLALALAPVPLAACATGLPTPLPMLRADDFRASRQRGVGYGLLSFGDRSPADNDSLVELGAGHVRMFLDVRKDEAASSYAISPADLQALQAVLLSLERRGLRMVLVVSFGPDARDALWHSPLLLESAVRLWRSLALQLKGRGVVAGFDIVNEPVPPGLTFAARQDRWLELAARITTAIRSVDPERVVIVESAPDATGASFVNLVPIPFREIVYSVHSYAPFDFTHQGVAAEHRDAKRYTDAAADSKSTARELAESLAPVERFASRHDQPIYVGEFSAPRWAPDDSAASYIRQSIDIFERNGWSWAYHEYRAWHGWDPEMASSQREPSPRSASAPAVRVLRQALRPRAGRS